MSVEQDSGCKAVLYEDHALHVSFPKNPYPVSSNIVQLYSYGFADRYACLPQHLEEEMVPLILSCLDELVNFLWCQVVG